MNFKQQKTATKLDATKAFNNYTESTYLHKLNSILKQLKNTISTQTISKTTLTNSSKHTSITYLQQEK